MQSVKKNRVRGYCKMAASMVDVWIDEYCSGKDDISKIRSISKAVERGEIEFHMFVEKLGPFLISPEVLLRQMGTSLFVKVLQELPVDLLVEKQVAVVVEFLCERLKEQHSIIPHVLQGILAMSNYKHLPEGSVQKLLQSMFREIYIPSQLQPERLCIYTTFANFLEHHLKDLQSFGGEFILGFIQVLDGERDPRCLLMAFSIIPAIIHNCSIGALEEEFFEVISCYFPVDFTPSPSDFQVITRDDIAEMLKKCLTATPKFAKFCVPLLMEKLDSDIISAKLDSLDILVEGCSSYGITELQPFLSTIWAAVRKELFSVKSEKVEESCFLVIKSLVEISSTAITETGGHSVLEDLLEEIWKDCKPLLRQPEQKLIHPTAKLLCVVAYSSNPAYYIIISRVLPLLMEQFHMVAQNSEKKNLLQILCAFLRVNNDNEIQESHPLSVHRESLVSLLFSLLMHDDEVLRETSLRAIATVVPKNGCLLDHQCHLIGEHIISLINSEKSQPVRAAVKELCTVFSKVNPVAAETCIVSSLCSKLENGDSVEDVAYDDGVLEYLVSLSAHEATMKPIVIKLTHCLIAANSENYIIHHLDSLRQIIELHRTVHSSSMHQLCIFPVLQFCLQVVYSTPSSVWLSPGVVTSSGRLIQTLVPFLNVNSANDLSAILVNLIVHNRIPDLLLPNGLVPTPFETLNERQQALLVTLIRSVLPHLPRETSMDCSMDLIYWLVTCALKCSQIVTRPASQTLAGLVNKWDTSDCCVGDIVTRLKCILKNTNPEDITCRRNALVLWTWLLKALLLKGDSLAEMLTSQLVESLADEELGVLAADGFLTILQESSEVLTATSHAQIRILYPQKFFMRTSPLLLHGYNSSNQNVKKNFLCALSHQLKFQHRSVLLQELPPLLPIIVESLRAEDPQLIETLLQSMRELLADSPSLFEDHVDSFLDALLNLATFRPSMRVRILALQCLELLTLLPELILLPHCKRTVNHLKKCLDDPKRLVRKHAVSARCKWFVLGDSTTATNKK